MGNLDVGKARKIEDAAVAFLPSIPLDINEVTAHPPPSSLVSVGKGGVPPLIDGGKGRRRRRVHTRPSGHHPPHASSKRAGHA